MLSEAPVAPALPASDLARARAFYEQTLELSVVEEDPGGVTFRCGEGSALLVYPSEFAGTNKATAAAFRVNDLDAVMSRLRDRGVVFEDYDLPGSRRWTASRPSATSGGPSSPTPRGTSSAWPRWAEARDGAGGGRARCARRPRVSGAGRRAGSRDQLPRDGLGDRLRLPPSAHEGERRHGAPIAKAAAAIRPIWKPSVRASGAGMPSARRLSVRVSASVENGHAERAADLLRRVDEAGRERRSPAPRCPRARRSTSRRRRVRGRCRRRACRVGGRRGSCRRRRSGRGWRVPRRRRRGPLTSGIFGPISVTSTEATIDEASAVSDMASQARPVSIGE